MYTASLILPSLSCQASKNNLYFQMKKQYTLFFTINLGFLYFLRPIRIGFGFSKPQSLDMHRLVLTCLAIFSFLPFAKAQKDNGDQCDCFKTNGSSASYFKYHRFFDYRNVPSALTSQPAVVTQSSEDKNDVVTSSFFSDSLWTNDWDVQTWDNSESVSDSGSDAHALMRYSKNNVYIGDSYPIVHYLHIY